MYYTNIGLKVVCLCIGSSSTSYGPDSEEDEDWAPVESSEDVHELVADANNFMSNKKMHKTV